MLRAAPSAIRGMTAKTALCRHRLAASKNDPAITSFGTPRKCDGRPIGLKVPATPIASRRNPHIKISFHTAPEIPKTGGKKGSAHGANAQSGICGLLKYDDAIRNVPLHINAVSSNNIPAGPGTILSVKCQMNAINGGCQSE